MKITGKVIHGLGNGKKVGMPTANIDTTGIDLNVEHGVYACKVNIKDKTYLGVCNIGHRPTIDDSLTIEVHIIDFDKDIYGEFITVTTFGKLRGIKKFDSLEEVKKQVDLDIHTTIELLK